MAKTILYGAFARHNFGDMLFPHILESLLKSNSIKTELEYCDIISRDMSEYGGHKVRSISDFFDYEAQINVIHVGGEVGYCSLDYAKMACQPSQINIHELNKISNSCMKMAYLLSKSIFNQSNVFIANSIGGVSEAALSEISTYEYIGFRDLPSYEQASKNKTAKYNLAPDSAVMSRYFFEEKISSRSQSKVIKDLNKSIGSNYIAIQISAGILNSRSKELAQKFEEIISKTQLPIVFFCAGIAAGHDSLSLLKAKFQKRLPTNMTHFFQGLNIWDICNLISNAKFVASTSLHVRILAQQYCVPRISIAPYIKQVHFIEKWDNIKNLNTPLVADIVEKSILEHDPEADEKQLNFLENEYLTKSTWVNLLK